MISVELHWSGSDPNIYSDLTGSFWGRDWVQTVQLPYLHSSFEYPVLSGLLLFFVRVVGIQVGALLGATSNGIGPMEGYYFTFSALSALAAVLIAWSCWGITKKLRRSLNPLFFLLPAFVIYGIYNFDLFHIMFVVLGIYSYVSGRTGLAAIFLGLTIDLKLTS